MQHSPERHAIDIRYEALTDIEKNILLYIVAYGHGGMFMDQAEGKIAEQFARQQLLYSITEINQTITSLLKEGILQKTFKGKREILYLRGKYFNYISKKTGTNLEKDEVAERWPTLSSLQTHILFFIHTLPQDGLYRDEASQVLADYIQPIVQSLAEEDRFESTESVISMIIDDLIDEEILEITQSNGREKITLSAYYWNFINTNRLGY